MSRSRLGQLEEFRSSEYYNDGYDMLDAESSNKTLESDLNFIRSQLRLLNDVNSPTGSDKGYDVPSDLSVNMYSSQIESGTISVGTAIDVGGNYITGTPYDLSVYLNGNLLVPSVIGAGPTIVETNDYQEVDVNGNLVEVGEVGRKIKVNYELTAGDIVQFIWDK
jgi:hypothetical protein